MFEGDDSEGEIEYDYIRDNVVDYTKVRPFASLNIVV